MSLATNVSLIVAELDLKLVQLVRGAMRAADAASGKAGGLSACPIRPAAVFEPRPRLHPTPLIEPRPRIHPTPRFEPRPVIHPQVVIEDSLVVACDGQGKKDTKHPSPIQPPWAVLPWQTPSQPKPIIKRFISRTDIKTKGSLLDLFI